MFGLDNVTVACGFNTGAVVVYNTHVGATLHKLEGRFHLYLLYSLHLFISSLYLLIGYFLFRFFFLHYRTQKLYVIYHLPGSYPHLASDRYVDNGFQALAFSPRDANQLVYCTGDWDSESMKWSNPKLVAWDLRSVPPHKRYIAGF